ncbi:MAG: hypothetical protein ACE5KH_06560 [Candidatus Geothermarchaeales archaeon]
MSTIHYPVPTHNCPKLKGAFCKIDGKRCTVLKTWQSCPKIIRIRHSPEPEKPKKEDPGKWEI